MSITKDLISFNSPNNNKSFVNYKYFIIQKISIQLVINLITRRFVICLNVEKKILK